MHKNLFCFSMGYQKLNFVFKMTGLQQNLTVTGEITSINTLLRFWHISLQLKSHLNIILKYAFANWVYYFYKAARVGSRAVASVKVFEEDLFLNNSVPYADQSCMDYASRVSLYKPSLSCCICIQYLIYEWPDKNSLVG